jgi:hypothetical protein
VSDGGTIGTQNAGERAQASGERMEPCEVARALDLAPDPPDGRADEDR